MTYHVMQPPKDEALFNKQGVEIVDAAIKIGIPLNAEGFLFSWVSGTRVIVEREGTDGKGAIIGIAFLTMGKRWLHNDFTASVMELKSEHRQEMLDFIINMASALGASALYVEAEGKQDFLEEPIPQEHYTVVKYLLQ